MFKISECEKLKSNSFVHNQSTKPFGVCNKSIQAALTDTKIDMKLEDYYGFVVSGPWGNEILYYTSVSVEKARTRTPDRFWHLHNAT